MLKLFQTSKPKTGSTSTGQVSSVQGLLGSVGDIGPPPQTIPRYRKMRENPVIAISRMAAHAPIKASGPISFQAEGMEDEIAALDKYLAVIWPHYLRQSLFAMDYGYSVCELVWGQKNDIDLGPLFYPVRVRNLLPELCEPRISKEDGTVASLKWDNRITLPDGKFSWFTYGGEGDTPFGEARLANCVKVWETWDRTLSRMDRYLSKVAGVIPMIEYPEGDSFDETGNKHDNFDLAKKLLTALSSGQGVVMPNVLAKYAQEFAQRGITPDNLRAWTIGFIETKGQHGADFEASLRALDRYLTRGYLVPERAVTEGVHGTKAESEVQSEFVIHEGEDFLKLAAEEFHLRLVRPFLEWNYGAKAAESVKTVPPTIIDENKAFLRSIVSAVLTQPATFQTLVSLIDIDSMLDQAAIPIREGVDIAEELDAAKEAAPTPPAPSDDDPEGESPAAKLSRLYSGLYPKAD